MKKKVLSIIAILLVVIGVAIIFTVAVPKWEYAKDEGDTEDLFRQNVTSIGFENTVETAIPQTELYNIIKNHFDAPLADGKTEKKAIIIGYDGCRADVLNVRYQGATSKLLLDGATMKLSYCGGVNYPEKNTQDTSTAPGWCSILTGVWADKHGVTANDITKSLEYKTLLTTLVEDETIDSSMFVTKWAGHFSRKNATYLEEKEYCEKQNLNVGFNKCDDDKASLEFAKNELSKSDCADFMLVVYEQTDSVGHSSGFTYNNPKYKDAFTEADSYGLETLNTIQERETYETEDWLIIITSDHGGRNTNHGGDSIQERLTFIIANKEF